MSLVGLFVLVLFLAFPTLVQAEGPAAPAEGMTQGQFALWLVKAIGAQSKIPPAAVAEDAIAFLTKLGLVPEGGWQKDAELTKEALASMVDDPNAANLSFNELVNKLRDQVQNLFNEASLAVFPAQASGSGSAPA